MLCSVGVGARHSKTVLATLVGVLIRRLWGFAMESPCIRPKCFNLPDPLHARELLWEIASMEKQRFRLRSSARLPPEAYRIRRMIHVFDVDSRPVPSGTSCSLSNQPLETMLCSRCAAEASLGRICRFCKPMPTRPSCTKDSGIFWCASADSLFLSLHLRSSWTTWCQWSLGDFSNLRSCTSSGIGEERSRRAHCLCRSRFSTCVVFSIDTVGPTFNFELLRLN